MKVSSNLRLRQSASPRSYSLTEFRCCLALVFYVVVCPFLGPVTADPLPDVLQVLELHYNSVKSLNTMRISGTELGQKMPRPIPQGSNWEKEVARKGGELKNQYPLWTDEDADKMARHVLGIEHGSISQKYEISAAGKGGNFAISRSNPEVIRIPAFSEEKIIEKEIPLLTTVQGPGLAMVYRSATQGMKAGQADLMVKPSTLVYLLSLGAIPDLGLQSGERASLDDLVEAFKKSNARVSEMESGLILISGEGFEYVIDPAHGWLLKEMNKFVVNDRGERVTVGRLLNSDFVESNSVWYPTKAIRESYSYDPSTQTAQLLDTIEYTVTKFEANVPVDDGEVDFILPAQTVISAQRYPQFAVSEDFPITLNKDESFHSLIARLNSETNDAIDMNEEINLLDTAESLDAAKTTTRVSVGEAGPTESKIDGKGNARKRIAIYVIPMLCIVIGILATLRKVYP